jgi:hypothetical protein
MSRGAVDLGDVAVTRLEESYGRAAAATVIMPSFDPGGARVVRPRHHRAVRGAGNRRSPAERPHLGGKDAAENDPGRRAVGAYLPQRPVLHQQMRVRVLEPVGDRAGRPGVQRLRIRRLRQAGVGPRTGGTVGGRRLRRRRPSPPGTASRPHPRPLHRMADRDGRHRTVLGRRDAFCPPGVYRPDWNSGFCLDAQQATAPAGRSWRRRSSATQCCCRPTSRHRMPSR